MCFVFPIGGRLNSRSTLFVVFVLYFVFCSCKSILSHFVHHAFCPPCSRLAARSVVRWSWRSDYVRRRGWPHGGEVFRELKVCEYESGDAQVGVDEEVKKRVVEE